MKKVVILLIAALAIWLGINYARTGKLSLSPAAVNPEQQELEDLTAELRAVEGQIQQAGRAAGMTGMDTTADVGALMARKQTIEKRIAAARARQRY